MVVFCQVSRNPENVNRAVVVSGQQMATVAGVGHCPKSGGAAGKCPEDVNGAKWETWGPGACPRLLRLRLLFFAVAAMVRPGGAWS